jgi:hypothetical protein
MGYIKIKHKEVKTCENMDWNKTLVLHLKYKIWKLKWEVNIKDYEDNKHNYKKILEKVKKHIQEAYRKNKEETIHL